MARRLGHGETITIQQFDRALEALAASGADVPFAFAIAQPVDLKDFDFLFPDLQTDPNNLLPEAATTPANLVRLGKTMIDETGNDPAGDSDVSALITYFGQFIDHDITLELASADLPTLTNPALTPLPLDQIRTTLKNARSATLDLDSVYDLPALRDGDKMVLGTVSPTGNPNPPFSRPAGKDDFNDLPRGPRTADPATDRAANIGDPRNDENTIVAQLHLAFLRAHNKLVDLWGSFTEPRRVMRQHYQHLVIHDFLMQVADKKIVKDILKNGTQFFKPFQEPFFMPLEFAVAAFRFGHTMVRSDYDFNVNFNTSGAPNTFPASLGLLFTFSTLSGELGDFETLPENWIIEWENFTGNNPRSKARLFDTKLVNPLFHLMKVDGTEETGLGAMLAVRNLLRGYLLRMPTGQTLATAMNLTPLTAGELEEVAAEVTPPAGQESQLDVLRSSGFAERTPLWYYILAEAAFHAKGKHLGPLGSTLVAEVLIGLIEKSENSILRNRLWEPTLPSVKKGKFTLEDLLRFADVLKPNGMVRFFADSPLARGPLDVSRDSDSGQDMISTEAVRSTSHTKFELDIPASLTPEYLHQGLAPYLVAISRLQNIFNEMANRPAKPIIVRTVSFQSPIEVSLEGAADIINAVKEDLVPWRRNHAKIISILKEHEIQAEIKKREAEAREIQARTAQTRAEAKKLEAEALKMHAEAEKQVLENERVRFELEQSKLTLALSLVAKMHPQLPEADRLLYAVKMLPAMTTLTMTDIEFKSVKMLE